MSMNMYNSRVSVGSGHAQDHFTDHLYDPLRKTFLEDTTAKKPIMYEAARVSKVSSRLSPRNISYNYEIVQHFVTLDGQHNDSLICETSKVR